MKKITMILFLVCGFCFLSGCSSAKEGMKKKVIDFDDVLTYEIYDTDEITESKQNGKIYVHTSKIPLQDLRNFEEKSYSKRFMDLTKNPDEKISDKVSEYLNTYDFSSESYALYNSRFDSADESSESHKRFFNHPIIYGKKVIGESISVDNAFHCFSYVFLYVSKKHLFTTTIELYRIDPSVLKNENDYFEKKNNDDLSYSWISESKRKEFYAILESDDFEKLHEEFQLLRKSKDLFLDSLKMANE